MSICKNLTLPPRATSGAARYAGALLCLLLTACGGGSDAPPVASPPPVVPPPVTVEALNAASRLATQSTFGMPYESLESMARLGPGDWLDAQFALPESYHSADVQAILARRDAGEFDAFEDDIEYLIFARRLAWWHNTITAEDVVRQRVAFALSQIFVVSDNVDLLQVYPAALSTYYDLLLRHAFGNYRDLLRDVALSPAMGVYLSHLNNRRADSIANTFPDENFAREVMQLFSIGLFELNGDGTVRTDGFGAPIASYDNGDIREFAKIFTGFSYGGDNAFFGNQAFPQFDIPMRMFDDAHEAGEKQLLNGTRVPAGQTGLEDVEMAIDNLFNHPNVGPFIGKQLIQRLVTSNPSPAYISRVSAVFADNGQGVRGDLRAVVRAILLDSEAREAPVDTSVFGKLAEPVVRYASILRQFGATSDSGFIAVLGYFLQETTRQHPLSAPSVFNFYLPTYMPPGELARQNLVAPEFSITNANTIIAFPNLVDAILFADFVSDAPEGFDTVRLDLTPWVALADDPSALVERLNITIGHGALSDQTQQQIEAAIDAFEDLDLRTRIAIYFTLIAPETAVRQ